MLQEEQGHALLDTQGAFLLTPIFGRMLEHGGDFRDERPELGQSHLDALGQALFVGSPVPHPLGRELFVLLNDFIEKPDGFPDICGGQHHKGLERYIRFSMDIPNGRMVLKRRLLGGSRGRKIEILEGRIVLTDEVEVFFEKRVTPVGNSAKVDAPRRYIGRRAYVIILKE